MSDGIVGYTNSDVASPLQACILRTGSSSQRVDRRWKRNNFVNIRCLSGAQTTDGVFSPSIQRRRRHQSECLSACAVKVGKLVKIVYP